MCKGRGQCLKDPVLSKRTSLFSNEMAGKKREGGEEKVEEVEEEEEEDEEEDDDEDKRISL